MKIVLINLILLFLCLKGNAQNIETFFHLHDRGNDGIYDRDTNNQKNIFPFDTAKIKTLRLNPSLVISVDTNTFKFYACPGCQSIHLVSLQGIELVEIELDKDGNILYFRQYNQNFVRFDYDTRKNRLLHIRYKDKKGNIKYVKLK